MIYKYIISMSYLILQKPVIITFSPYIVYTSIKNIIINVAFIIVKNRRIFEIPIVIQSSIFFISGSMFRTCVLKSSRQIWKALGRSEAVLSMGVRSLSCVYCIFVTIRTLQERSVLIANLSPVTRSFSSVKKITLVYALLVLCNKKGYHRDDERFDTRAYEEEAEEMEEMEELKEMEEMEEMEERRRARKAKKARKANKAASADRLVDGNDESLQEEPENDVKTEDQLADDALLVGFEMCTESRMLNPWRN